MKKLISVILVVILLMSVVPMGLFGMTASAATEYEDGFYTYTISNGKVEITDCDTSISGDVKIPSILGGYPVTSIGGYAFFNCSRLTCVTIPDGAG